ncbi:putative late blight resistance protein-like protein R1A-3 [Forsythia ovata]|uniref:Late blight resistance protein-like protein R1A-3 n=1 Tax=Forsythia ovata TaxID=205694 RepID=A0ABD1T698_9LAMI
MDDLSSESSEQIDILREALIRILFDNMYLVSTPNRRVIEALWNLESLPKPRNLEDLDETSNHFQELVSLGQKLKRIFQVRNQQIISNITHPPNPNQVVAAFIDFLLLMLELFLRYEFDPDSIACVEGSIEILWRELGFLIAFLGDTAMHLQPAKNILIDIEAVVNEVGSFFYAVFFTSLVFSLITENDEMTDMETMVNEVRRFLHSDFFDFFEDITTEMEETKNAITDIKALFNELGSLLDFFNFTGNDQVPESGIIDLALSNLLPKFELLKTKIKEHCITVSKMPSDMAPNTSLVSLFIVDSVLDDLKHLINNNSERIVDLNDQIITLHEELMSLGSSITDIAVQQEAEHEELVIRTRDIAYEVEYVINSLPPVWYLTLRLPQLIEKIQLIRMSIQEIKNKLDVAGVPEVPYRGEQVSSQSEEPPILEDNCCGFRQYGNQNCRTTCWRNKATANYFHFWNAWTW